MNHALSNKIELISIVLLASINIKTYLNYAIFTLKDNILNNESNNVNNLIHFKFLKILNNTF